MWGLSALSDRAENSDRDLYSGLIRLHILHHAVKAPIFGLGMLEELERHGYKISPGTLYPLLHGLEQKGYLGHGRNGMGARDGGSSVPRQKGRQALLAAKRKIRELFVEIVGE
jgi:DNA-binding PadR family transcriptional regulator